jgi:hypothetical protein
MSIPAHPRYFYDENGQPQMVLLSYAEYVAMVEELEDQIDSALADKLLQTKTPRRPLREIIAERESSK